jgi:hypothetical protein
MSFHNQQATTAQEAVAKITVSMYITSFQVIDANIAHVVQRVHIA